AEKTGAPQGRTAKEDRYDQTSGQAGMKARTPSCGKPSWVKVQPKAGSAISSASSRSSPAGFTPSCSQVSMASRVELNSAMEKSQRLGARTARCSRLPAQQIIARRLHAVLFPGQHGIQGRVELGNGEVTVTGRAYRPLHQVVAPAVLFHPLTIDLLHLDRYEQVAEGMHGDHRNVGIQIAIDLGNQPQTVIMKSVGVRGRYGLDNGVVETLFSRGQGLAGQGLEAVGDTRGIDHRLVQNALDGAIVSSQALKQPLEATKGQRVDRPRATGQVLQRGIEGSAGSSQAVCVGVGIVIDPQRLAGRLQLAGYLIRRDRERIGAHTGELEQCQAVGTEVVEQFGITHHAAHGSGASIGHEVVGSLLGLALDGGAGNVAIHGDTGDVDLVGLGKRTAILLGNVIERQSKGVGILEAGTYIVEVGAVGRGGPGIAVIQQILAHRRVVHGQIRNLTAIAVGVHDQHAIPVLGNLDAVAGPIQHAVPAAGTGIGITQCIKWLTALVYYLELVLNALLLLGQRLGWRRSGLAAASASSTAQTTTQNEGTDNRTEGNRALHSGHYYSPDAILF